MNILIGYGYQRWGTGSFLERALQRQAATTFVGTSLAGRSGFTPTGDLRPIIADLPAAPDLFLYVDSGEPRYFPRGLPQLPCPTACYLIDVHQRPVELQKQAMFFDYAFSAQLEFVSVLRRAGHPQASWLPLACDTELHRPFVAPKRYDIGFAGSVRDIYARRRKLLEQLQQRFSISDYRRSYTPLEMSRLYSESRLVFNCSLRHEVNMRVFEGPASGSLLLTDRIGNGLSQLVTDREHVVMYDDADLVAVAAEYIGDERNRERIAQQGCEHVLAHHTYDHRINTLLQTVFGAAGGPHLAGPLRRRSDVEIELAYAEIFALMGRVDDTIEQYVRVPRRLGIRSRAAKQLALCLLRRTHYLLER